MSQQRAGSQTRSRSGSQSRGNTLPPNFKQTVSEIIREVGVNSLTKRELRNRLESKYSMDFSQYESQLDSTLRSLLAKPEFRNELKKHQGGSGGKSGSGKRGRSPGKSGRSGSRKGGEEDEGGARRRGRREKKPEGYPKSALSAYILFSNDCRDRIQKQNPEAKITEVSKLIAAEWGSAAPNVRAQYEKRAAADKHRFEKEMEAYKARGGEVFKRGQREGGRRAKKDPNAPKRALSAYMFFAQDFRTKNSGLSITEQMSKAGEAWRQMSDEAKRPYEAKAAKDKERYEREKGKQ